MIAIRTTEEIENIRSAGKIARKVLDVLSKKTVPGVTTLELNRTAEELIVYMGGIPAFKDYKGYPSAICASVNSSIVHEIPSSSRVLNEGDIIGFDVGVGFGGYFADAAQTVGVGRIPDNARKLIDVTRRALELGQSKACENNRLSDISHAVQVYAEAKGFSVVRHFVGHGIGKRIHEEPEIPNFGPANMGPRLKEGMVLAIEPMINEGSFDIKILDDGWTAVTKDGKLSAHFENTVVVGKTRPEILT